MFEVTIEMDNVPALTYRIEGERDYCIAEASARASRLCPDSSVVGVTVKEVTVRERLEELVRESVATDGRGWVLRFLLDHQSQLKEIL